MSLPSSLPSAPGDARVGEQLRTARERQGVPIEAIARPLRVPVRILRALEEGECASLPADVYVRGFLTQYAEFLGLDPVPLLRAFAVERARFPKVTTVFPWTLREQEQFRLWEQTTPRRLAMLGGAFALLAVLLYGLVHIQVYVRPPRLEVFEPPYDAEVAASAITVRGRTDATATLLINGEQTAVQDDGTFEETIRLGEGVNTLQFVVKSISGRQTTVVRDVLVRTPSTAASAGSAPTRAAGATAGPFALTVRAEGEAVWVSLSVDGAVAFSGILLPGAEHTVRGERIAVTSGKAQRTSVRINEEDWGVLRETAGAAHRILFTRDPRTGTIERHEPPEVPRS